MLEHYGLENNPIARARARKRVLRDVLGRRSDLAVWVNSRLHTLDQPHVLVELANEVGLLQPPVTAEPARAERASSPSSMDAAA